VGRKSNKPKIDLPMETPNEPEAETKILAALCRGYLPFDKVKAEDFYERKNKEIYKVLEYHKSLIPNIDPDIIHKEISKGKINLGADGLTYIVDVIEGTSLVKEVVDHWYKKFIEASKKRELSSFALEIQDGIMKGTLGADEAINMFNALNIKSSKKSDKDINYIAHFDNLVDLVDDEGVVKFLVIDNGKLKLLSEINIDGDLRYPPPKETLLPLLKKLPRAKRVSEYFTNDNDSALYDDLINYHKNISELPDTSYYDLLTLWDFHKYIFEKFQYSPYIWLYGVAEKGKSRTGKGCIYVAYRGMHLETVRDAHIVRMSKDYRATMFFDVSDLWKKATKAGSEDVFLARFEKGTTVLRTLFPEKGSFKDTVAYEIYGPTIIGTNEEVDSYLGSRSLRATMQQTNKLFNEDVTPEAGLPFKERLVAFRARHMNEELPFIEKPFNSRLGDISRPLLQVLEIIKPEKKEIFMKFLSNLNSDKLSQKSESKEGKILVAILDVIEKFDLDTGDKIRIKDIVDEYNNKNIKSTDGEKFNKFNITPTGVGKDTQRLGLPKGKDEISAYVSFEPDRIYPTCISYGIEIPEDIYPSTDTSDTFPRVPGQGNGSREMELPEFLKTNEQ